MGLENRRWAKNHKDVTEPKLKADITGALGFEVPVEIDWDGFSAEPAEASYIDNEGYGLPQLSQALAEIARDDLGKEALKAGVKTITVKSAKAEATSLVFEGGAITWNAYFGATSSGYIYKDAIVKTLEAKL